MRIPRFYCPELNPASGSLELSVAAHRHAIQVLRMKQGESLQLFNGLGLEYDAVLEQVAKRSSSVKLGDRIDISKESLLNITLLQGISRGERMDYALQKAVELGVNRVIPVLTERCNVQLSGNRADKRLVHWQSVMVSACEQSGRSILPELDRIMPLSDAIKNSDVVCKLVLDPQADAGFSQLSQCNDVVLLIGAEGGLTKQEIHLANTAGFRSIKFGPRILRTETATVAALAVVQAMWGDLG